MVEFTNPLLLQLRVLEGDAAVRVVRVDIARVDIAREDFAREDTTREDPGRTGLEPGLKIIFTFAYAPPTRGGSEDSTNRNRHSAARSCRVSPLLLLVAALGL